MRKADVTLVLHDSEVDVLSGNTVRYRQETPDPEDVDVLSDLYLGTQAVRQFFGEERPPGRVRVTFHFDDPVEHSHPGVGKACGKQVTVTLKRFREMGRSVRYAQIEPDPKVLNIIPSPYVGKGILEQVTADGHAPEYLYATVYFDEMV